MTSIIAVVTVINGLNSKVTDLVTGRGADVFILDRMGTSDVFDWRSIIEAQRRPELTNEDALALSEQGENLLYVAADVYRRDKIWGGNRSVDD
ncbi:MAG: hypothetical protein P8Y29_10190, partial [Gemmatimonadota bacterium]